MLSTCLHIIMSSPPGEIIQLICLHCHKLRISNVIDLFLSAKKYSMMREMWILGLRLYRQRIVTPYQLTFCMFALLYIRAGLPHLFPANKSGQ